MVVTSFCAVAIPSTAGSLALLSGPSLIPTLIRAGFKPAIAAAAIVLPTTPAPFQPRRSLTTFFVAKLADMEVMAFTTKFFMPLAGFSIAIIVGLTVICFLYRDYKSR